jgi:hypothetical protein
MIGDGKPKTLSEIWNSMQSKMQSQMQQRSLAPQAGMRLNNPFDASAYSFGTPAPKDPFTEEEKAARDEQIKQDRLNRGLTPGIEGQDPNVDVGVPGWSPPTPGSFLDTATKYTMKALTSAFPMVRATDDPMQQAMMDRYGIRRPDARDIPGLLSPFAPIAAPAKFALAPLAQIAHYAYKKVNPEYAKLTDMTPTQTNPSPSFDPVADTLGFMDRMSQMEAPTLGPPTMDQSFMDSISSMMGFDPSGFGMMGSTGDQAGNTLDGSSIGEDADADGDTGDPGNTL